MAISPSQFPPSRAPSVVDDDADYQYAWTWGDIDVPIPRWLAEIVEVPLIVRWELFLIGVCAGLILAAIAVLIGFTSAA
jgi:hypothetical protein